MINVPRVSVLPFKHWICTQEAGTLRMQRSALGMVPHPVAHEV